MSSNKNFAYWILALLFSPCALANVSIFDQPLKTQRISLGLSPDGRETTVSCQYFKDFMVKQIDLAEKGAAQLSILPTTPANKFPTCQQKNVPDEYIIQDWSGYFKGVKEQYVFFDNEDGTNGGMNVAVFDGRNKKKIFTDLIYGNFETIKVHDSQLTLQYIRAYTSTCSVVTEKETCWNKIKQEIGLKNIPMPDCISAYMKTQKNMAHQRCQKESGKDPLCFQREMKEMEAQRWNEAPSMIGYRVNVNVRADKAVITPIDHKLICWASS